MPFAASGLAIVVTDIDVTCDLPVEILPGHFLRRAREREIPVIREFLGQRLAHGSNFPAWQRFEWLVTDSNGQIQAQIIGVPPERWRYWVVAFNGKDQRLHEIARVSPLLTPDIDMPLLIYFEELDQQGRESARAWGMRMGDSFDPMKMSLPRAITREELSRILKLVEQVTAVSTAFPFVAHALDNYLSVRAIDRVSEMRIVGFFSVIEALITHKPRRVETLDSIGHQVSSKAVLLRKRFGRDIDPANYFDPIPEPKLWDKLHEYRSRIAHGESTDIAADLSVLRNRDSVDRFLRAFAKELIVFGLHDPAFLADLKPC